MKTTPLALRVFFLAVLLAALTFGCNNGKSTGPGNVTLADMIGSWIATKFEFKSKADGNLKVDIISKGGTFTLTISADNQVILVAMFPGQAPETDMGTISVEGDSLFLDLEDDDIKAAYTLFGNTLQLSVGDAEYDFNEDGTDEPATVEILLNRAPGETQ